MKFLQFFALVLTARAPVPSGAHFSLWVTRDVVDMCAQQPHAGVVVIRPVLELSCGISATADKMWAPAWRFQHGNIADAMR